MTSGRESEKQSRPGLQITLASAYLVEGQVGYLMEGITGQNEKVEGGQEMAVIYIRIAPTEKKLLEAEARNLGMRLTTYCRMLLIKSLETKK